MVVKSSLEVRRVSQKYRDVAQRKPCSVSIDRACPAC
jgi:hypothetical protein